MLAEHHVVGLGDSGSGVGNDHDPGVVDRGTRAPHGEQAASERRQPGGDGPVDRSVAEQCDRGALERVETAEEPSFRRFVDPAPGESLGGGEEHRHDPLGDRHGRGATGACQDPIADRLEWHLVDPVAGAVHPLDAPFEHLGEVGGVHATRDHDLAAQVGIHRLIGVDVDEPNVLEAIAQPVGA